MLLTITADRSDVLDDASDLGYLLHKHPDRVQRFEVHGGQAYVFYPESTPERCTAALLLEVDPIALVKGRDAKSQSFSLGQYVNDRPYAASSLVSVAMGKVFRTALGGRCDSRQHLADAALPLTIEIPAVPGGADLVGRMFSPMGWTVEAEALPLDPAVPAWGDSTYVRLVLTGTVRLADALNHLYVLLPVLDGSKHYWVSDDEVDKLMRAGEGWLATHPERELISRRYLAHQRSMTDAALTRLAELDGDVELPADV
ncbi:MAG: 3' terminal RNA ribose 2'-O-methyltransferase Hen1, partial [Aeromicrobium sp.]